MNDSDAFESSNPLSKIKPSSPPPPPIPPLPSTFPPLPLDPSLPTRNLSNRLSLSPTKNQTDTTPIYTKKRTINNYFSIMSSKQSNEKTKTEPTKLETKPNNMVIDLVSSLSSQTSLSSSSSLLNKSNTLSSSLNEKPNDGYETPQSPAILPSRSVNELTMSQLNSSFPSLNSPEQNTSNISQEPSQVLHLNKKPIEKSTNDHNNALNQYLDLSESDVDIEVTNKGTKPTTEKDIKAVPSKQLFDTIIKNEDKSAIHDSISTVSDILSHNSMSDSIESLMSKIPVFQKSKSIF